MTPDSTLVAGNGLPPARKASAQPSRFLISSHCSWVVVAPLPRPREARPAVRTMVVGIRPSHAPVPGCGFDGISRLSGNRDGARDADHETTISVKRRRRVAPRLQIVEKRVAGKGDGQQSTVVIVHELERS